MDIVGFGMHVLTVHGRCSHPVTPTFQNTPSIWHQIPHLTPLVCYSSYERQHLIFEQKIIGIINEWFVHSSAVRTQPNFVGGSPVYWETCDKSQQSLQLVCFCLGSFSEPSWITCQEILGTYLCCCVSCCFFARSLSSRLEGECIYFILLKRFLGNIIQSLEEHLYHFHKVF